MGYVSYMVCFMVCMACMWYGMFHMEVSFDMQFLTGIELQMNVPVVMSMVMEQDDHMKHTI